MISSSPTFKSIYFDFTTKFCYTFGSNINSRFKFDFLLDEEENLPENVFIDGSLFLNMVKSLENSYSNKKENYVVYKENTFYSLENRNEKYKLPSYQDKDISLNNFDAEDSNSYQLSLNDFFINNLKNASLFACQQGFSEKEKNLMGVFIKKGRLLSTDSKKFFDFYLGNDYNDLDINSNFIKVLLLLKVNTNLKINKIGENIKLSDGDIDLLINNSKINIPAVDTPEFISVYNHSNFITFNKAAFLNILSYLSNFLNSCSSNRLNISINDTNLVFKIIESDNNLFIEKSLPVLSSLIDQINNMDFYVNINYLKMAVSVIPFDNVKMQISTEKIGINISGVDDSNNSHVVLIKMVG
jgi:hypothetical protein